MKNLAFEKEKENGMVKSTTNEKTAIRPAMPLKSANQQNEDKAGQNDKADKPTIAKVDDKPTGTTIVVASEDSKSSQTKTEIKEQLKTEKPALNLDATIKLALDLNRRINQRSKLLETIESLETFEVTLKDDADETDSSNHYQRCELTIEDDKGREFTTKNPFIINAVAKMVNQLCVDKLAEIEGEIFIPA